jgi:hypothetical protein
MSKAARKPLTVAALLVATQGTLLYFFGQPLICACGYISVYVYDIMSEQMSQQLFDWYSFSHIIHGFIFYLLLWTLFPKMSVWWRFAIAVGIEGMWEIAENTPWVINAYRQQALAKGYVGDSVINSLMDNVSMMFGFILAWKLPWRVIVLIAIVFEVGVAYFIHDNLTLNILGFIHHFDFIDKWQMSR